MDCFSEIFVMENNEWCKLLAYMELVQLSSIFPFLSSCHFQRSKKTLLASAWHSVESKLQVMVVFSWRLWAILMSTIENCIECMKISQFTLYTVLSLDYSVLFLVRFFQIFSQSLPCAWVAVLFSPLKIDLQSHISNCYLNTDCWK